MLGSVVPSSRFLIGEIAKRVDWKNARVIVEYGPGTGVITKELLRRARPDARVIAVELNPNLAALLRSQLTDSRLTIIEGSATEIDALLARAGVAGADHVIAGIPFSIMAPADRQLVLEKTRDVLVPGGSLIIYQFSRRVRADLRRVFGRVTDAFELLNFLPAHIFQCTKE